MPALFSDYVCTEKDRCMKSFILQGKKNKGALIKAGCTACYGKFVMLLSVLLAAAKKKIFTLQLCMFNLKPLQRLYWLPLYFKLMLCVLLTAVH